MQIRKLRVYDIVEATCSDIVSEGLGLSHIQSQDHKPLTGFILGVMPGEVFLAKVTRVKSNHFHGVLLPKKDLADFLEKNQNNNEGKAWIGQQHQEKDICHEHWALIKKSAERKEPECGNFTYCGSCKLLHMSYEKTIEFKKKWLSVQLQRNHVEFPDIQVIESPRKKHYRNHVQIHINKFAQRGFYAPYSYTTKPFPESGCLLFDQRAVDENFPEEIKLERCVRARIDYLEDNTRVWSLYSKEEKNDSFTYHINYPEQSRTSVSILNRSFFQTNTSILPNWLGKIKELIHISKSGLKDIKMLELFSGFGFISKMLSFEMNIRSMGIDILHPRDLGFNTIKNSAAKNLGSNGSDKADNEDFFREHYIQQDLSFLSQLKPEKQDKIREFKPEIILLNPPRSGFLPSQLEFLFTEIMPDYKEPVIYSSCNGATFARDCAVFQNLGFKIENITLLDFFPWTSHYEVLALLKKN